MYYAQINNKGTYLIMMIEFLPQEAWPMSTKPEARTRETDLTIGGSISTGDGGCFGRLRTTHVLAYGEW